LVNFFQSSCHDPTAAADANLRFVRAH
jgi:hypothetical protein